MRLRSVATILLLPAFAVAGAFACSRTISDHAPPAEQQGDAFALGDIDHFPGWDADADARDGDARSETIDAVSETETETETETDAGAEADADAEPDTGAEADDVAEVGDTFDATPVVDECGPPFTTTVADAGSCSATIQSWADEGHAHYDPGTIIEYCTKPPNSGPHYYVWASYRSYDRPIPYGYLVHDLEHGAVDVYYQCPAGSTCPTLAAQLQSIIDARPVDPLCDPDAGVSRRVILSPDPTLPVLVAAAAWGWTYTADCVDAPTLGAFIDDHYAMAAEDFCTDGIVPP